MAYGTGLFFTLFPTRQAANMESVEALRSVQRSASFHVRGPRPGIWRSVRRVGARCNLRAYAERPRKLPPRAACPPSTVTTIPLR